MLLKNAFCAAHVTILALYIARVENVPPCQDMHGKRGVFLFVNSAPGICLEK
jgi:hypothetical protein